MRCTIFAITDIKTNGGELLGKSIITAPGFLRRTFRTSLSAFIREKTPTASGTYALATSIIPERIGYEG